MLKAVREFTLVHVVNAARRQVSADLWTKPIGLYHKLSFWLPSAFYYYSARTLKLVLPSHTG